MNVTVHITGPIIQVEDRAIQRCALCGEKLFDKRRIPKHAPVHFMGRQRPYRVNSFVEQQGEKITLLEPEVDKETGKYKIPHDLCIDLVEEYTHYAATQG